MGEMGWREGKWFIGMKMTLQGRTRRKPARRASDGKLEMEPSRAEGGQGWSEGRSSRADESSEDGVGQIDRRKMVQGRWIK
jgi:hypothetical protein